jgi:hypothetical protein
LSQRTRFTTFAWIYVETSQCEEQKREIQKKEERQGMIEMADIIAKNIENNESNKTTTTSFFTVCLLVCLVSSTNHPATKFVFVLRCW